jgi:hypothetical protein
MRAHFRWRRTLVSSGDMGGEADRGASAVEYLERRDTNAPAGRVPVGTRVDHCHDTTGIDAAGGFLVCQSAEATELVPLDDVARLVSL